MKLLGINQVAIFNFISRVTNLPVVFGSSDVLDQLCSMLLMILPEYGKSCKSGRPILAKYKNSEPLEGTENKIIRLFHNLRVKSSDRPCKALPPAGERCLFAKSQYLSTHVSA